MAYRVSLTERALGDLDYLYEWVGAETGEAAIKWYNGLKHAIFSLARQKNRGLIPARAACQVSDRGPVRVPGRAESRRIFSW